MGPRPVHLWSSVSLPIKWEERKNLLNNFFQLLNPTVWNIVWADFSTAQGIDLFPRMVDGTLCSLGKWDFPGHSVPFSPEREPAANFGPYSFCSLPSLLPLSLRIGPLPAPAAAHSATVPVRASCLTARASIVSALRSSSDEDPESLPFGEWPAPRANMSSSLRGLRTPFSRALELQMACPAHQPGNQQWRAWLPAE